MKLSVLTITRNHIAYLAQAVGSALAQRTAFDFEIVIGDDASTDGTSDIAADLQRQHPGKITLLLHRERLGMFQNFHRTLDACRGDYVAILEGDDFWTSEQKLQRQVEQLDAQTECVFNFHKARLLDEATGVEHDVYGPCDIKDAYDFVDIVQENFIPACSIVARRGYLAAERPAWIGRLRVADWPMHILGAHEGRIGYINETMATYRRHPGGIWSSATPEERLQTILEMYAHLNAHFEFKYDLLIKALMGRARALARHDAVRHALQTQLDHLTTDHRRVWHRVGELGSLAETLGSGIARLTRERDRLASECHNLSQRVDPLERAARLRQRACRVVPVGATVIVIGCETTDIIGLEHRQMVYLLEPGNESTRDRDADLVARLEAHREAGAQFAILPFSAAGYLDADGQLRAYLERRYSLEASDSSDGLIFSLQSPIAAVAFPSTGDDLGSPISQSAGEGDPSSRRRATHPARRKTIRILTYCTSMEALYGSTLTLRTLRVGFPTTEVEVIDNHSIPEAAECIQRLARESGCSYRYLDTPTRHEVYLSSTIMDPAREGPLIILDPDIAFWGSCEDWEFDALLAGRLVPMFWEQYSRAINLPRLHPSFWWINDLRALREKIREAYGGSRIGGLDPFLPYHFFRNGRAYKFDTGSNLYGVIGRQTYAFGPSELDRFDHLGGGTHAAVVIPAMDPVGQMAVTTTHGWARDAIANLKNLWKGQDAYWGHYAVHDPAVLARERFGA